MQLRPLALAFAAAIPLACASTSEDETPPAVPAHTTCAVAVTAASGSAPDVDLVLEPGAGCGLDPGARVAARLRVAVGDPAAPRWTGLAEAPVVVEGRWEPAPGGLRRTVKITNRSAEPVSFVGVEWSFDVAALKADRFFHNGYQSWSYTGIEAIPPSNAEERGTFRHAGQPGDTLDEQNGAGSWVGAVLGAKGKSLVVGADGGTVLKTFLAADGARLRVLQGGDLESVPLAPGESRALDGLFVAVGDLMGALDAYAGVVAAAHPPVRPLRPALGGWGSWNLYYSKVTAQKMRDEASYAKTELLPRAMKDFLLDDGYEPRWGRWTAKPEFGASLEQLAQEQTAAGLVPAIWLAPFVLDGTDPLVKEHPEYFVGDGAGKPKMLPVFGHPDMAVLDPTHDGARTFLRTQLAALVAAGYRTFKLDFIYAGALPGVRARRTTALEAYAEAFRLVHEALAGTHIVGCGAPMLPSVGWVDSFRTGPDIAFELTPEPFYTLILAQARHSALRAFTDRFWALDPDVLLLRGARIDEAEAWTTTVATVLTGGNYLLGDGRQAGARATNAIAPSVLELARDGRAARPDDVDDAGFDPSLLVSPLFDGLGTTAVPHVWRKTSADGKLEAVAVFGWNAEPFEARVALPAGAVELGPGGAASPAPEGGRVVVDRHAVRLFVARRP